MIPRIQERAHLAGVADNRWEVTSERYRGLLAALIAELGLGAEFEGALEVGRLFNGAALHADGRPCVSWSPVGLAFGLPLAESAELIRDGHAMPLKYFAKGRVKRGWALFENPERMSGTALRPYFLRAIAQAAGRA